MSDLHTAHRPKTFDEVIGHEAIIKSLKEALDKKFCHAFSLVGEAGRGKTSIARIIASYIGCDPHNIVEVDAASKGGIDDMKEMIEGMMFAPFGKSKARVYILDECHRLSAPALASLLKVTEEPPANVYWIFCTSESLKIPATNASRFIQYKLGPIGTDEIFGLLQQVCKAEKLSTSEDVLYFLAEKADGNVRLALTTLAQCSGCKTRKEAAVLVKTVAESSEAFGFCQALARGNWDWTNLMGELEKIGEVNIESVRCIIVQYFSKMAKTSKDMGKVQMALQVLQAFETPFLVSSGFTYPLLLSIGQLCFE